MASSTDAIIVRFPHDNITPIQVTPTYEAISAIHRQLNANVASIDSNLGDGKLGLLGLTISNTTYEALSDGKVYFMAPTNPIPHPTLEDSPTAAQITDANCKPDEMLRIWREYQSTDQPIKNSSFNQ